MSNEVDLDLGTFDLADNNNIAIADIDFRIAKSLSQADLPKAHGSIVSSGKRKNYTVKIKGTIIGTNYDALRSNLDALKAAVESDAEQKLTLDDDRYMMVHYTGFAYSYKTLRTFADFSFDLIAADPFWYSESLSSNNSLTTAAPSQAISNGGNAAARLKITITAGGTPVADDILIENTTADWAVQYRGTIAAGESVVINHRVGQTDFSVENDGEEDMVNFEGDLPYLDPGSNTITLTTGVAGVTITLEWRDAYL